MTPTRIALGLAGKAQRNSVGVPHHRHAAAHAHGAQLLQGGGIRQVGPRGLRRLVLFRLLLALLLLLLALGRLLALLLRARALLGGRRLASLWLALDRSACRAPCRLALGHVQPLVLGQAHLHGGAEHRGGQLATAPGPSASGLPRPILAHLHSGRPGTHAAAFWPHPPRSPAGSKDPGGGRPPGAAPG